VAGSAQAEGAVADGAGGGELDLVDGLLPQAGEPADSLSPPHG